MPLHVLDERLWFPPISEADDEGLLAIGGDLHTDRLILAYQNGIFPWYDGEIPLWWSPNPRFVLFPDQLKVSKSMKVVLNKKEFQFKYNTSFRAVITNCKQANRKDQDGTWINQDMINAYCKMHELGYAYCAETWLNDELVGGLYGIWMGNIFFGESMFSHKSNASKFAFINWVEHLKNHGVVMIDCQVYTEHLESLGAGMINRDVFLEYIVSDVNRES